MIIIKKPPNDSFTLRLFSRLTQHVKVPADIIYTWTLAMDPNINTTYQTDNELYYRKALIENINKDLVVLGVKDHLTCGWFNPYIESKPNLVLYLEDMFNFYHDKTFIVFTSTENLTFDCANVHVINWGGDITNQRREYPTLNPVIDKNFNSTQTYISLNRNHRHHRTFLLSALMGFDLKDTGFITCMFSKELADNIEDMACPIDPKFDSVYRQGYEKLKNAVFDQYDSYKIYPNENNDNVYNFKQCLSNYYKNSFVEIITETSFTEPCYLLTEKTLNSIYGCNFPILLGGQGSVEFLRTIGFDMFDDIVDHSYDTIADPLEKIYFAIERNKHLLNDPVLVKDLWVKNKQRFLNNIDVARVNMYDFYAQRAETQWYNLRHLYENLS